MDTAPRATGLYQTLEEMLAADPRLVAGLLGYVRYPYNPAVQAEALRIAGHLSARLPDLLPLLAGAGASLNCKPVFHRRGEYCTKAHRWRHFIFLLCCHVLQHMVCEADVRFCNQPLPLSCVRPTQPLAGLANMNQMFSPSFCRRLGAGACGGFCGVPRRRDVVDQPLPAGGRR